MRIGDLVSAFEAWAPRSLAEDWDNTGLLLGDPSAELASDATALLTIDLTEEVLAEAREAGVAMVVAYHPPIFEPMKRWTTATRAGRVALGAASAGIAIYSPHTALDAVRGGMTDWLADGVTKVAGAGAGGSVKEVDRFALMPKALSGADGAAGGRAKVVTFVPEGATERVRSAMAGAGAGAIGAYTMCSFASMGAGTFLGGTGSNPAVGQAGRLEYVAEIRLEMVCDAAGLPAVLAALRGSHPYEEPAIDVYALSDQPRRDTGAGRVVALDAPLALEALAGRIAERACLGAESGAVRVAGTGGARRIAVIPGAGGSLIGAARAAGCDAIVTGEMKHHEVLAATAAGLGVVLAGHTETERGYLAVLAERLAGLWPGVRAIVSRADGPPTRAA